MVADTEYYYFNIHHLVRMRITRSHPCAYSIRHSFEHFQVDQCGQCDLTLVEDMLLPDECSYGSTVYTFGDSCVRINTRMVDIALRGSELVLAGRRDLLPYVHPLIHWIMLSRGATTVHGASIAIDGKGILMPAWGGTGKTSAVIELLKLPGSAFMGDDHAILCEDGMLLSCPKPFFIYPYHKNLFPYLFEKKPKFVVPAWMSGFMARVRQAVRPTLARFPRLESFCRRFTPEHMHVPPRQALPDADFAERAPLRLILFLERYGGSKLAVDQLDRVVARRRVVGNHYFEQGIHAQELMTACAAGGLLGLEEWFGRMSEVVDQGFAGLPIHRLRVPSMNPAQTGAAISSAVCELLSEL